MAVTIPSSDTASTQLNGVITALTTQISNVGTASPVYAKLTRDKANAQFQLVSHLIGAGHLSCASILSNETYISGASDGL
jgi:hypothetical protein